MKNFCNIKIVRWLFLIFFLCKLTSHGALNNTELKENLLEPIQIAVADGTPLTDLIAVEHGLDFTIALRQDGTVWGWGNNEYGQLGVGITSKTVAAQIQTLTGLLSNVASISCDELSTTATRDNGTSWKSSCESILAPWFKRNEQNLVPKLSDKKDHNNDKQSPHNQSDNNNTQSLLSAQNSILAEEDPWENNPLDPVPEEPFSVSLVATGPYRAPANIELVASVTDSAKATVSKIEFYNGGTLLGTVTDPPYEFAYQDVPEGKYTISAIATDSKENTRSAQPWIWNKSNLPFFCYSARFSTWNFFRRSE